MPHVPQPVTEETIKVREVTHYQFTWVAGDPGQPGTYTLQLVLDQGAQEAILTLDPEDADNLQEMLVAYDNVYYDLGRRTLIFGVRAVGG